MVGLGFSQRSATVVVATSQGYAIDHDTTQFQSQTRSRPGCHLAVAFPGIPGKLGFNLKREAAPVATLLMLALFDAMCSVSISNEKPPRLPRSTRRTKTPKPARFQSQTRSRPGCH